MSRTWNSSRMPSQPRHPTNLDHQTREKRQYVHRPPLNPSRAPGTQRSGCPCSPPTQLWPRAVGHRVGGLGCLGRPRSGASGPVRGSGPCDQPRREPVGFLRAGHGHLAVRMIQLPQPVDRHCRVCCRAGNRHRGALRGRPGTLVLDRAAGGGEPGNGVSGLALEPGPVRDLHPVSVLHGVVGGNDPAVYPAHGPQPRPRRHSCSPCGGELRRRVGGTLLAIAYVAVPHPCSCASSKLSSEARRPFPRGPRRRRREIPCFPRSGSPAHLPPNAVKSMPFIAAVHRPFGFIIRQEGASWCGLGVPSDGHSPDVPGPAMLHYRR